MPLAPYANAYPTRPAVPVVATVVAVRPNVPQPSSASKRCSAVGDGMRKSTTPPIALVPSTLLPEPYVTATSRNGAIGEIWKL